VIGRFQSVVRLPTAVRKAPNSTMTTTMIAYGVARKTVGHVSIGDAARPTVANDRVVCRCRRCVVLATHDDKHSAKRTKVQFTQCRSLRQREVAAWIVAVYFQLPVVI